MDSLIHQMKALVIRLEENWKSKTDTLERFLLHLKLIDKVRLQT
jgi:hypothetical protein